MKKILSLLMAMAMTITVMLVVVPPVEVSAATTYDFLFPVNNGGVKIAYLYGYTSNYYSGTKFHRGIDIHSVGDDTIYSAFSGTVTAIFNSCEHVSNPNNCTHKNSWGNCIQIKSDDGKVYAIYGHLKQNSMLVVTGDKVQKGQPIASMGSSGNSSGKHLHFELRTNPGDYNTSINVNPTNANENNGLVNYSTTGYLTSEKKTLTIYYHANGGTIADPIVIGTNYKVSTTDGTWAYARSGPGTSYSQIDGFAPGSIVTVIETKKMSDYTWGKIKYGKEAWVALGSWMTHVGTAYDPPYYLSSSIVYDRNTSQAVSPALKYGEELKDGLYNNTTFKLSRNGYNFVGWSLTADGSGVIIDQDKVIKPEDIVPELADGSLTVTMYAIWESTECIHDYQYQSDNDQHWQQCANCGYKTAEVPHDYRPILATSGAHLATEDGHYMGCDICQKATRFEHTYDNSCDAACNVCEYTRVPTHNYEYTASDNKWCWQECTICGDATEKDLHRVEHSIKYDETHHWVVCKDCAYLVDYTPHNFTNDCDTTCNTCEYTRTTEHTYDNGCDNSCNICGAIREVGTHTWKNSYNHNASNHWKECTSCGYKTEEGAHNYTPALSSSGNYLVTKVGHYMTCDICDRSQLQDHIYDNDCDAVCNICNFESGTRNPDHSYSNSCDTSCNACGAIREVVTHTFDNSCDTDCNICGETRSTQHVYDDENDTTCNICGEVRTVETLPTTTPADTEPNTEPSTEPSMEPNKKQESEPDINATTNNNNSSNSDQNDDNDNGIDDTTIIVVAGAVAVSFVSAFGIALIMKKKR